MIVHSFLIVKIQYIVIQESCFCFGYDVMKKVAQICILYLFLRFYNAFETLLVMF